MDPEIEAMAAVAAAVANLDDDTRSRVLRWAGEKYGLRMQTGSFTKRDRQDEFGNHGPAQGGDRPAPPLFSHFVDLFDKVNPKVDTEKALAAAYWLQEVQNQASWEAQTVNNILKDVGHGIANITSTLHRAQARKPALVRQVAKSGRARQARKTYKLTTAGLQFIGGRVGAAHGEGEASGEDEGE